MWRCRGVSQRGGARQLHPVQSCGDWRPAVSDGSVCCRVFQKEHNAFQLDPEDLE